MARSWISGRGTALGRSRAAGGEKGNVPTRTVIPIDWLEGEDGPLLDTPGRVALASCPGRTDVGGDVESDVRHLAGQELGIVVSLVGDGEMERYGVFGLRAALGRAGIRSIQFPVEDTQPPINMGHTRQLCQQLLGWLGEGTHVLIHCIGGWGRSGTLAAALLTHQGYEAQTAIKLVRQARSPRCVESRAQERFVHEYARIQAGSRRYYRLAQRSELAGLVSGAAAERLLRAASTPPELLLDAAALPRAVQQAQAGGARELLVLSGELFPEANSGPAADYPLDRAFGQDGQQWRALPLADLLK